MSTSKEYDDKAITTRTQDRPWMAKGLDICWPCGFCIRQASITGCFHKLNALGKCGTMRREGTLAATASCSVTECEGQSISWFLYWAG